MARTVAVQYVGPHEEVHVPSVGVDVARGAVISVSVEVAGMPPSGDEPGSGLLAQSRNWQRAADATTEPPAPATGTSREEG